MKNLRTLLLMCAGVAMSSFGTQCFAQEEKSESNDNEARQVEIRLVTEGTEGASPELHGGRLPLNEGHPRFGLSFPGQPSPGAPSFGPPGLRMEGRAGMHPGQGPQIHRPDAQGPDGPFAENRRRIAALTESAERIAQAGLPDVAHGLRERAGQLERELAEMQERMQQEQRQRTEAAMRERQEQARQQPQRPMEQRRAGIERGDQPSPPLRELHEQMEQLRRDMHKLSEQMAVLTRLIQQHHHPRADRGQHGDMDKDGDDEDGDDEEGDMKDREDDDDDHRERGKHENE